MLAICLENHFSAGDASLEEKERAVRAEAAPGETHPLLHPQKAGRMGAREKAAADGLGSDPDPEASLSNASASESAAPGEPAGRGGSAGPPGAAAPFPRRRSEPWEGGRAARNSAPGEGPGQEAEGPAGSGEVPEEAAEALGEAAAGPPEPENAGDSLQPGGRDRRGGQPRAGSGAKSA